MKSALDIKYLFWFSDQELEDLEKELNETLFYLKHKNLPVLREFLQVIHSYIEPSKLGDKKNE